MSHLWRLGEMMGEVSRLLSQSIIFPTRERAKGRVKDGAGDASKGATHEPETSRAKPLGSLALLGGLQIPDDIIAELIKRAGGRGITVAIIPATDLHFVNRGERYARSFKRFGIKKIEQVGLFALDKDYSRASAQKITNANLVFIGNGDTDLLVSFIRGTPLGEAIMSAYTNGALIAGIGSGAAIVGRFLPQGRGVAEGLALLPNAMVDCHIMQSGRPGGIFRAMAVGKGPEGPLPPEVIGLSLDEATAFLITKGMGQVYGEGGVTVIKRHSERGALLVHVLLHGDAYDLERSTPLLRSAVNITDLPGKPSELGNYTACHNVLP